MLDLIKYRVWLRDNAALLVSIYMLVHFIALVLRIAPQPWALTKELLEDLTEVRTLNSLLSTEQT